MMIVAVLQSLAMKDEPQLLFRIATRFTLTRLRISVPASRSKRKRDSFLRFSFTILLIFWRMLGINNPRKVDTYSATLQSETRIEFYASKMYSAFVAKNRSTEAIHLPTST